MSDFVPMRDTGDFRTGLVLPGKEAGEAVPQDAVAVSDSAEEAGDEEAVEGQLMLPDTPEALQILLDEVRSQARADVEAMVADELHATKQEQERAGRIISALEQTRMQWREEVRNLLGEMVVVGVRQVVSDSVELQAEMLRDRFAEVGERLIGERDVIIRVSPEDEAAARELVTDREGWTVIADRDLAGGIIADTAGGKIDATMGAALSGLADAVHEWQAEGVGEE